MTGSANSAAAAARAAAAAQSDITAGGSARVAAAAGGDEHITPLVAHDVITLTITQAEHDRIKELNAIVDNPAHEKYSESCYEYGTILSGNIKKFFNQQQLKLAYNIKQRANEYLMKASDTGDHRATYGILKNNFLYHKPPITVDYIEKMLSHIIKQLTAQEQGPEIFDQYCADLLSEHSQHQKSLNIPSDFSKPIIKKLSESSTLFLLSSQFSKPQRNPKEIANLVYWFVNSPATIYLYNPLMVFFEHTLNTLEKKQDIIYLFEEYLNKYSPTLSAQINLHSALTGFYFLAAQKHSLKSNAPALYNEYLKQAALHAQQAIKLNGPKALEIYRDGLTAISHLTDPDIIKSDEICNAFKTIKDGISQVTDKHSPFFKDFINPLLWMLYCLGRTDEKQPNYDEASSYTDGFKYFPVETLTNIFALFLHKYFTDNQKRQKPDDLNALLALLTDIQIYLKSTPIEKMRRPERRKIKLAAETIQKQEQAAQKNCKAAALTPAGKKATTCDQESKKRAADAFEAAFGTNASSAAAAAASAPSEAKPAQKQPPKKTTQNVGSAIAAVRRVVKQADIKPYVDPGFGSGIGAGIDGAAAPKKGPKKKTRGKARLKQTVRVVRQATQTMTQATTQAVLDHLKRQKELHHLFASRQTVEFSEARKRITAAGGSVEGASGTVRKFKIPGAPVVTDHKQHSGPDVLSTAAQARLAKLTDPNQGAGAGAGKEEID